MSHASFITIASVQRRTGSYLVTMQLPERDGEDAKRGESGWLNADVASVRRVKSAKKVRGLWRFTG